MAISPLTPLSLVASLNLYYLEEAFYDLYTNYGFHVDYGSSCCETCGFNNAWDEGSGKPFVFWHEQSEERLHKYPSFIMPLYFGLAKEDPSNKEFEDAARKIITVLERHQFPCDWKDGEFATPIMVHLDAHEPYKDDENDPDIDCWMGADLYIPKNDDTNQFCENCTRWDYEPENSCSFNVEINAGESLKDAVSRVDLKAKQHITHYMRFVMDGRFSHSVGGIVEIDEPSGHIGCGASLLDAIKEKSNQTSLNIKQSTPSLYEEFNLTTSEDNHLRLDADRNIVLEAVKLEGYRLKYADDKFKRDREVVLAAVKSHGSALQYADQDLKADRQFVLKALEKNSGVLLYADEELKADREVVLAAVKSDDCALIYAQDRFKGDREVVLGVVKSNGFALSYVDDKLKSDRQVVLAAVKSFPPALQWADNKFKSDPEVVLEAVKSHGSALQYADQDLKADRQFVLAAVKANGEALKYASTRAEG